MNTQKFTFWKFCLFFGQCFPHGYTNLDAVLNEHLLRICPAASACCLGRSVQAHTSSTGSDRTEVKREHREKPQVGQVCKQPIMLGVRCEAAEESCELLVWIWGGIAQLSVISQLYTEAHSRRGFAKHEPKC